MYFHLTFSGFVGMLALLGWWEHMSFLDPLKGTELHAFLSGVQNT